VPAVVLVAHALAALRGRGAGVFSPGVALWAE
jgi:hypothetical protein